MAHNHLSVRLSFDPMYNDTETNPSRVNEIDSKSRPFKMLCKICNSLMLHGAIKRSGFQEAIAKNKILKEH